MCRCCSSSRIARWRSRSRSDRPSTTALDWALRKYQDLGVVAFDEKNAKARHDAVGNTVEVSLGFLADERQRCLELGVLHEDTDVPFSVLGTLWGLKDTQVQDLAQRPQRLRPDQAEPAGTFDPLARLHPRVPRAHPRRSGAGARASGGRVETRAPGARRVSCSAHRLPHRRSRWPTARCAAPRATQLLDLLNDERFQKYQRQHGDATALDRKLTLAIARAAESATPQTPALVASLVLLRKSYAAKARDAALVFQAAEAGRIDAAADLLALFEADRHWDTLARLLIAWIAPPEKADEARALVDETSKSLRSAAVCRRCWPGSASPREPCHPVCPRSSGGPDLRYVSAILQRAGGAENDRGPGVADVGTILHRAPTRPGSSRSAMGLTSSRSRSSIPRQQHPVPRTVHRHSCGEPVRPLPQPLALDAVAADSAVSGSAMGPAARSADRDRSAHASPASISRNCCRWRFVECGTSRRSRRGDRARRRAAATDADQPRRCDPMRDGPTRGRTTSGARRRSPRSSPWRTIGGTMPTICCASRVELPKGFAGYRAPSALTLAESTRIARPDDAHARELGA